MQAINDNFQCMRPIRSYPHKTHEIGPFFALRKTTFRSSTEPEPRKIASIGLARLQFARARITYRANQHAFQLSGRPDIPRCQQLDPDKLLPAARWCRTRVHLDFTRNSHVEHRSKCFAINAISRISNVSVRVQCSERDRSTFVQMSRETPQCRRALIER